MGWDRHKLLWYGTDKYVPWTTQPGQFVSPETRWAPGPATVHFLIFLSIVSEKNTQKDENGLLLMICSK